MPVIIVVGILLLLGIVTLVRLIAGHPLFLLYAMAAVPVLLTVTVMILRGATRHAVRVWSPPKAISRDSMLPLPAAPRPEPPPGTTRAPFSSSSAPDWDALIEQAERAELLRSAPREARVVRPRCEGPDCRERLDGNPWVIQVRYRGTEENHSFCSRECAEDWQDQDAEERSGRRR